MIKITNNKKTPLTTESCINASGENDKYQLSMYFIDGMYRNESEFDQLFANQKESYYQIYHKILNKQLSKYVLMHNVKEYINQKYYKVLMNQKRRNQAEQDQRPQTNPHFRNHSEYNAGQNSPHFRNHSEYNAGQNSPHFRSERSETDQSRESSSEETHNLDD